MFCWMITLSSFHNAEMPPLLTGALTIVSIYCVLVVCVTWYLWLQHTDKMQITMPVRGRCKPTQIIFLQSTQSEKLWAFANYEYDAFGRRLRLTEMGNYENKTFTVDYLLHYREVTKAMRRTSHIFILDRSCSWSDARRTWQWRRSGDLLWKNSIYIIKCTLNF